jgi:hypothetical protein
LASSELHVIVGHRDLEEEFTLCKHSGRFGAFHRVLGGRRKLGNILLECGLLRRQVRDLLLVGLDRICILINLGIGNLAERRNLFVDPLLGRAAGQTNRRHQKQHQCRGKSFPHHPPPKINRSSFLLSTTNTAIL